MLASLPCANHPASMPSALHVLTARDRSRIRRTSRVVPRRSDDRLRRRSERHTPDLHAAAVLAGLRRSGDPRRVRLQVSVLVAGREAHLLHVARSGPGEHLVRRRGERRAAGRDRERDPRRGRAGRPHAGVSSGRAARRYRRHLRSLAVHTSRRRTLVESSSVEAAASRYDGLGDLRFNEGAFAFSPDGTKLLLSVVPRTINLAPERRGWQMWILPLPTGQPYRRLQWWRDAAPRATSFTWLPDSRHIVLGLSSIATPGSDLWLADLANDRAWPLTRSPDSEVDPSASPSGEQVVFTRDESEYDLVEIPLDGGPLRPLLATSRNESDPAWSSDGNLFAYVTDRNGPQEIWLRSREGERWLDRALITQRDFGDDLTIMLSAPSISPDGQPDCVSAKRRQADLAVANLDFPDRWWRADSASPTVARGLSECADLVARRRMDCLHRVERRPVDAGQGARGERRRAGRAPDRRRAERDPALVADEVTGSPGKPTRGSCWSPRTARNNASCPRPMARSHVVEGRVGDSRDQRHRGPATEARQHQRANGPVTSARRPRSVAAGQQSGDGIGRQRRRPDGRDINRSPAARRFVAPRRPSTTNELVALASDSFDSHENTTQSRRRLP